MSNHTHIIQPSLVIRENWSQVWYVVQLKYKYVK